jgi:hypothetical protein
MLDLWEKDYTMIYKMWSYALSTPINKGVWTPPPEEKFSVPPSSTEQTQNHRVMNWVIKKNPNQGIFPVASKSGRLDGKVFFTQYK